MSTFTKAALAAAAIVISTSSAAMARSDDARYVMKSISNGPRPPQYVLVRVERPEAAPYSLTGTESGDRVYRSTLRPAPLHPRGTQSAY